MRSLARLISIIVVVMMLFTAVPMVGINSAAEDTTSNAINAELPASYKISSDYIMPVRNQGSEGVCWAFANCALLETELLRMGYDNTSTVLSPLYEACSVYDSTAYSGSGQSNVLLQGSLGEVGTYCVQPIVMLTNGYSPMYEYIAPYSEIGTMRTVDSSIASCSILDVRSATILNSYTDVTGIKQLLYDGHAAVFNFYAGDQKNTNVPRFESISSSHAVELIGWDDNYSKDNFEIKPEGDGAWITKNSWGTSADFDGYTYVSYYSSIENVVFYTDVSINDGTIDRYSYDYGYSYQSDKTYRGSVTMANVFTCSRDGYIDSASFSLFEKTNPEEDYTFTVYKLDSNYRSPTDGKVIAKGEKSSTNGHNGVFNCNLNSSEKLQKGDKFSICVELKGDNVYVPIDTYECYYNNNISYTEANSGESYICYGGQWTDVSADGKSNIRIKAYISTEGSYEAKIGNTYYEKFSDALNAAKAGETVILLKNVTCDAFTVSKDICINSKGFDLKINTVSKDQYGVAVNNCNLTLEYGRILSESDYAIYVNGGSLTAKYVTICTSAGLIKSDNAKIALTSFSYDGKDGSFSFTGGEATLNNCILNVRDNDDTKGILTSDGCKVRINGGTYTDTGYVQTNVGDIKVMAGTFNSQLVDDLIDSESFQKKVKGGNHKVCTREVTVQGYEESVKQLSEAFAFADYSLVKLMKDVVVEDCFFIDHNQTLDMNGYNITFSSGFGMLDQVDAEFKIINTSSSRSSISTSVLINNLSSDGSIIIGDNVDITCSRSVYSDYKNLNVSVSENASLKIVEETTDCKTCYSPYVNAQGQYCEHIEVTVYGEGKTVKYVCSGNSEILERSMNYVKYMVSGEYKSADGNVLGVWERVYARCPRDVMGENTDGTQAVDLLTDKAGNRTLNYSDTISRSGVTIIKTTATYNGKDPFVITTESVGKVSENITSTQIQAALSVNETAEKIITDRLSDVKDYRKCITFTDNNNFNKILKKDAINDLLDKGYDVGVNAPSHSYVLKSGTGKLVGDTKICIETAGYSDLTKKQDDAVGTGVAYNIYAIVDGSVSKELHCKCEVSLYKYHGGDSKVAVVNSDGTLSNLDVRMSNNGYTTNFTVSESCIVAVNASTMNDEKVVDGIAIVVVVITVLVALGLLVWFKRS